MDIDWEKVDEQIRKNMEKVKSDKLPIDEKVVEITMSEAREIVKQMPK